MATPDEIRAFAAQYGPMAAQQAARLNTTPENVLSQWALETGYGKSIIPGTNNLGNIKGAGVSAVDNQLGTTDSYRAYATPAAGAAGYGDLLQRRYPGVAGTQTPQDFAQAVQAGGYAEDPRYVDKLTGTANTLQRYASNVLGALTGSGSAYAGELTPAQRAYANAVNGPTPPPTARAQGNPRQQAAPADDIFGTPSKVTGSTGVNYSQMGKMPAAQGADDAPDIFGAPSRVTGYAPAAAAAAPAGPAASGNTQAPPTGNQAAGGDSGGRGFLGDLGHQIGLTTRAALTGIPALAYAAGDVANAGINLTTGGINSVLGTNIPQLKPASAAAQNLMDMAGVSKPENAKERVVQDITSAMASAASGSAAGGALSRLAATPAGYALTGAGGQTVASPGLLDTLAQRATPALQTAGDLMAARAGTQIAAAAGGAGGSAGAREAGFGPLGEIGGGLLGTIAGAGLAGGIGNAITARQDAAQRALLNANPDFQQQQLESAVQRITGGTSDLPPTSRLALAPEQNADDVARLTQAAVNNPGVDVPQLQRAQDFRALGMEPTTGQISRDPGQFTKEQNLRAAQSQLATRFSTQDRQLGNALDSLSNVTPLENYQAGSGLTRSLSAIDDQLNTQVSNAYTAARNAAGARLDVPTQGLAQDYARIADQFGDAVPSGVRNQFENLGLMGGTQRRIFDIEDANQLTQVINKNVGNDVATNRALTELRTAVNNAVQQADDQGGVFAPAKALAAQRFQLHDAIPALKAAATDSTAADNMIQRYVTNGDTESVQNLANLLRQHAPDQFQQMRSQLVQSLQNAAYGTGEQFRPNQFTQRMAQFGTDKLAAFFSPEEIAQLKTIGRVGSYMRTSPSAASVNYSNSLTGLLGSLSDQGLLSKIPMVGRIAGAAADRSFANQALQGGFQQMAPAALAGPASAPGLLGLLGMGTGAANRPPH